jgi:hypothetical protein
MGGRPLSVLDLSTSGFLIQIDQTLPVGTCIVVEMPDGACKICKIAWNSGNYHGAQFSEPLTVAELDSLLSTHRTILPKVVEPVDAAAIATMAQAQDVGSDADFDGRMPFVASARLVVGAAAILWVLLGTGLWLATG